MNIVEQEESVISLTIQEIRDDWTNEESKSGIMRSFIEKYSVRLPSVINLY